MSVNKDASDLVGDPLFEGNVKSKKGISLSEIEFRSKCCSICFPVDVTMGKAILTRITGCQQNGLLLCNTTLCDRIISSWSFEGIDCLHLQGSVGSRSNF